MTRTHRIIIAKKWNYLLFNRHLDLDNNGRYNRKLGRVVNYRQLLELLLDIDPVLRSAWWHLKELYSQFNQDCSFDQAEERLSSIIQSFFKADIPEYREFIVSLTNWRSEIINSFRLYKGLRLNNGVAESTNSRISLLLFSTKGMRNNERRRKRIMYSVNKTAFRSNDSFFLLKKRMILRFLRFIILFSSPHYLVFPIHTSWCRHLLCPR